MVRVRGEQRFVAAPFEKVWESIREIASERASAEPGGARLDADEYTFAADLAIAAPDGAHAVERVTVHVKRGAVIVSWETGALAGSRVTCKYEPYGDVTRVASHGNFNFVGVDDRDSLRMLAKRFLKDVCATNRELFQWP